MWQDVGTYRQEATIRHMGTSTNREKTLALARKERLHTLVEDLPESEVHAALRFIEYLRQEASDPVARALREAPFADEPLTAEDLAELEAAEHDRQKGRVVSHDEARRELLREP